MKAEVMWSVRAFWAVVPATIGAMPSEAVRNVKRAQAAAKALPPVAVVVSRYNRSITDVLLDGALRAYAQRGGRAEAVRVVEAPGAYELPALAHAAASTGRYRGVAALGCIIKGETSHDQHIASAVAQGLVGVTIVTGVPCAFGVLTVDTPAQAQDRAGGAHGNKGQEAMDALLDTIDAVESLQTRDTPRGGKGPGFGGRKRALPDKAAGSRTRGVRSARRGAGGTR